MTDQISAMTRMVSGTRIISNTAASMPMPEAKRGTENAAKQITAAKAAEPLSFFALTCLDRNPIERPLPPALADGAGQPKPYARGCALL
jgi:hypothetical protein